MAAGQSRPLANPAVSHFPDAVPQISLSELREIEHPGGHCSSQVPRAIGSRKWCALDGPICTPLPTELFYYIMRLAKTVAAHCG